jgi:hypothetical protein
LADDDLSLRRDAARGAQAQRLLDDELLKGAFEAIRQRYVDAWLGTDTRDDDGRQRCWLAIKNLDLVQEHLQRVVANGVVAAKQIELIEAKAKREKRA